MRLGIMQPYFFPYLGHFALIAQVDKWLVFDITQYTPKTWMNRNRILHPSGGAQYLTIALSNSSISIKTHEARVLDMAASRQSVLGKLTHYKRFAPYYSKVKELVEEVFDRTESESLVDLNVNGLKVVTNYLGLNFDCQLCSRLNFEVPEKISPGGWAPRISRLMGAKDYINPISGRHIFSPEDFKINNVNLCFLDFDVFEYKVGGVSFEPNLSIIDVLMWNTSDQVLEHLEKGTRLVTVDQG